MDKNKVRRVAIIGGGFYGAVLAIHMAQKGYSVSLFEQEEMLMQRASYHNQARVHGGYHYPRSFVTARRSRYNLPQFLNLFAPAIEHRQSIYAITRHRSLVTAGQFERFCRAIVAPLSPAPPKIARLFSSDTIEAVYLADEPVFNTNILRELVSVLLTKLPINIHTSTQVFAVNRETQTGTFTLGWQQQSTPLSKQYTEFDKVFHATYSGLGQLSGVPALSRPLKHELTEMALVQVPPALAHCGVTVMDGPFFSLMPFPARGLHTLSHVRYTPQRAWQDVFGLDPRAELIADPKQTRFERMRRDAARYLPLLAELEYRDSLFEVKTVPLRNEIDDGRPILLEEAAGWPSFYSVLGGKIDNIFDVLEAVDALV